MVDFSDHGTIVLEISKPLLQAWKSDGIDTFQSI